MREDLRRLAELAREKEVALFLMGNPMHMSGREGVQSGFAREFADRLGQYTGIPVEMWDERLTSVEAGRVLRESGIGIEKRARAVDRLSAVILLNSYLDALAWRRESGTPAADE
jgi:putative pre-16S rRNA nuclease